MSHSTALRLCYAFGSNIDVARCGWGACMMSNSRIDKNGGATLVALGEAILT
ncbi:MAG: hypothetical protein K2N54_01905 [Helicobacter sp.]|nr:hypothetical protein [Helicobacter sp.]